MAWVVVLAFFGFFVLMGILFAEGLYWFYLFGATITVTLIWGLYYLEKMHENVTRMTDYLYRIHVDTRDTCDAMERVSPPPEEDEDEQDPEQAQPARKKKGKKKNV